MTDAFEPGDILVFQVESGYGLMKVIGKEGPPAGTVWHIKAYRDLFMDVEMADMAAASPSSLGTELPHAALTDRAFESTQVSKIAAEEVSPEETAVVDAWRNGDRDITDRSVRLLLGLR